MTPDAARAEAARRLGASLDTVREQLHHSAHRRERRMRLDEHLDNLLHDLRYAARGLRRRPAFTAIAVLTLAIGIGATTSIFSAVNVLLIRQLPYAKPDELMKVSLTLPAAPGRNAREDLVWSYPKFTAFRNAQQVFADLTLYASSQYTITSGDVELIRGEQVGATYLRTLGVVPARGRDFERSVDDHPNAERQTIISRAFWERRYNADPDIVGKTVDLDGKPFTIIGITPDRFAGLTGRADLFVPITTRAAEDLSEVDSHEFYAVGRRKAGVTVGAAVSAVSALGKPIHDAFAQSRMGKDWTLRARPLEDARIAPLVRRSLLVLFGAVAFVLLIACVNVANLLLGRASVRRQEIAVRLALGAARARLVRLLLTESLVLAALGGVASLVVALFATRALAEIDPAVMIRAAGGLGGFGAVTFSSIRLDWSALAFTFGITLVVGLIFGLLPALHATRTSLVDNIKGSDTEVRASTARRLLVVGEVALALILLAGSGLMIRSLSKLLSIDTGFDGRNVLTLRLTIPPGGLARDSMPGFYDELLNRLRAVPGVADVALNNCPPLAGGCNGTRFERLDRPEGDPSRDANGGVHWATSTWFAALGVPLKQGRTFAANDRLGAPKVMVINETAARTMFPNESPLGKRISVGQGGFSDGGEVIGVVGNVRQSIDSAAKVEVYIPYLQAPRPGMMIFLRTQHDPISVTADVRRALHEVAPRYPVYDIQPMTARAAAATAQTRFNAILLGLFAATALSLAVIGIYGVMSLAVAARTRELGIRIALGADQRRVRRLIVGEGAALVGIGAAIGLGGALASTRVLQKLLFDLEPSDPITYASILVLLSAAAIVASWLPARRASRVDPVVALRSE